jgi:hypothetical protein
MMTIMTERSVCTREHFWLRYMSVDVSPRSMIQCFEASILQRFYSVAVITSGSDRHYSCNVGHPGDPGSIPGKTFPFALAVSFLCRDMRKKVLKMLLECFFSEEIELIMLHPEVKIERREEHRILLISIPCRFNSVLDEGARFSNS